MLDRNGKTIEIGSPVSIQCNNGRIVEGNVVNFDGASRSPAVLVKDHESKEISTWVVSSIDIEVI